MRRASQHAPCKAAALLEIIGVRRIIGIGSTTNLDMAFDFGLGHPVELENTASTLCQTDSDAKGPPASACGEVLALLPVDGFGGVSSFSPLPELLKQVVVHRAEGPAGCCISEVIGPTAQERIELPNERLLGKRYAGLDRLLNPHLQVLDAALCRPG